MNLTSFSDTNILYFFFRFFLLIVVLFNVKKISKTNKVENILKFWPTILSYTLVSGLRWGRPYDYNVYYYVYNDIVSGYGRTDNEPLFTLLVKIAGAMGCDWQGFVIFMSFVLITSGCYFLKSYPQYLTLSLPLFCLSLTFAENVMRWYLGYSFVLIGLSFLMLKNDYKKFIVFSLLGFFIHYGLLINIILLLLICLIRKPLNPRVAFIIYVCVLLFFSMSVFSQLANVVSKINIGTRFLSYQENAQMWLDADMQQSTGQTGVFTFVENLFFFYGGYKLCSKSPKFIKMYNIAVIACIFYPIAMQLELLIRINSVLYMFKYIVMGFLLKDILLNKSYYPKYYLNLVVVFCIYYFYSLVFHDAFMIGSEHYFIWDADGRKTLGL